MITRHLLSGFLWLLLLLPSGVFAQDADKAGEPEPMPPLLEGAALASEETPTADTCRRATEEALAREQRLYRSVLFGLHFGKEAGIGTIRYDKEGRPWLKVAAGEWRSTAEEMKETKRSDGEMQDESELPERRGLFERRRVLTSELLPYLTQSMRALQCRTQSICAAVVRSVGQEGEESEELEIELPNCRKVEASTLPACHLVAGEQAITAGADALSYCWDVARELLHRETVLLKTVVEYDAGYRTMLQIAGTFDALLEGWRWFASGTLHQVVRLVGLFERIPCFSVSCGLF